MSQLSRRAFFAKEKMQNPQASKWLLTNKQTMRIKNYFVFCHVNCHICIFDIKYHINLLGKGSSYLHAKN